MKKRKLVRKNVDNIRNGYVVDKWFVCPHCGLCQPRDLPGFLQDCYQCGCEV